jgi:hypothetical protein
VGLVSVLFLIFYDLQREGLLSFMVEDLPDLPISSFSQRLNELIPIGNMIPSLTIIIPTNVNNFVTSQFRN